MMKRFSEQGIHYVGILSLDKLIFHLYVILCKPNETTLCPIWKYCVIRFKHLRPIKSGSQQVQCACSPLNLSTSLIICPSTQISLSNRTGHSSVLFWKAWIVTLPADIKMGSDHRHCPI